MWWSTDGSSCATAPWTTNARSAPARTSAPPASASRRPELRHHVVREELEHGRVVAVVGEEHELREAQFHELAQAVDDGVGRADETGVVEPPLRTGVPLLRRGPRALQAGVVARHHGDGLEGT